MNVKVDVIYISTANRLDIVTDMADVTIDIKFDVAYRLSNSMFTFDLHPF